MSLDTQAKYKIVRVADDWQEISKILLNKIVIKKRETNDLVYLTSIEDNYIYCVSKSQIELKPYYDLRGQDSVNTMLQGCSFDSIVAINGVQHTRLIEQIAKSRGITLEIHEDIKWIEDRIEKPYTPLEYIMKGKPIFQKDLMKTLDDYKYYHFSLDDKKRLPDEVIFKDGKTTLLFSVNNDGKAPYNSYSSKVAKGDTFDKEFGFLVTYLKYLKDNYKVVLQECFDFKGKARLSFLYGVVRQLCENNNIDVADLNNYAIHILNNDRYTLKQYNDWKREIENKAMRYTKVVNEIETKEKELDKLKKQKENLK